MCLLGCVSREASLDEFVGGSDSGSEASEVGEEESADGDEREVESEGSEVDGEEAEVEDEGVEGNQEDVELADVSAASATYVWTPASDACARCGSEVGRLWRCEGELVCGECKEW